MTISPWVGLRLDPLDTLFFRDGRPFDATSRVSGGLPTPQTLAGALRTALLASTGFDFPKFAASRRSSSILEALKHAGAPEWVTKAQFRGPWLGLARGGRIEPLLPVPAMLNQGRDDTDWVRSTPLESGLPGWHDPDGLLPLLPEKAVTGKATPGLLTLSGVTTFLQGGRPNPDAFYENDHLYGFDNRVGIGIDMHSLTSADGDLYGIRLLALKKKVCESAVCRSIPATDAPTRPCPAALDDKHHNQAVCLYAEMAPGPNPAARPWLQNTPVPFGGEGRYVHVTEVQACEWPVADATRARSMWYLATPTFLSVSVKSRRSLPTLVGLKAAASEGGLAVSGWDVARNGPRPTRFAVPGGAVYFVEGDATEWSFLAGDKNQTEQELRAEGWDAKEALDALATLVEAGFDEQD